MKCENLSNMVNLCSLLLKYNNFSKVEDDIFLYIDRILENAFEIHKKQAEACKELAALEEQIAVEQKRLHTFIRHSQSPVKKRKVQSLDSTRSECKENVSILEDSTLFLHKSDNDVSSKLELNILDSDEPFFALTQTPPSCTPPAREALSPRNEPSPKASTVRAAKLLFADETKSPKKIIRESRFSAKLNAGEPAPVVDQKPVVYSPVTPTSNSKWTGKKVKETLQSPNGPEHTPVGLKRFHSLADSNQRFRQAKLNFPRQNKHSPGNVSNSHVVNDTLLSDFVVPTPPSVANKSKFLRSLRMKKQSTMISKGQSDRSATKETKESSSDTAGDVCNRTLLQHAEADDINQTYCSGVESINRIVKDLSVNIKQEPVSQPEKQRDAIKRMDYVTNQQATVSNEDSESNDIILIRSASQQSIMTVVESQYEDDKFITELYKEQQAKRTKEPTGLATSSMLSNNMPRTNPEYGAPSGGMNQQYNRIIENAGEGLCNECMKLYKFHTARGVSNDAARTKLPRNCRGCRFAQLHNTPPGFWDPDFLPTPQ